QGGDGSGLIPRIGPAKPNSGWPCRPFPSLEFGKGVRSMSATNGATTAYSYVRFSHPSQAEGDSLRRQTERAAADSLPKGWTLDLSLKPDQGISAFRGKNAAIGALGQFLKFIELGRVKPGDVLVVESVDRISREGIDSGYDLCKRILKSGVKLVTLN